MTRTKHHGKGAIVSAFSRFIHPSEHIRNKCPNPVHSHRLAGCVTLQQQVKKVNHKDQLCLVICHDDFKNDDDFIELHAVVKHWKVEVEGGPDLCFTARVNPQVEQEGKPTPLPQAVDELHTNQATTEETVEALHGVVDINDDNDPAPENIPEPNDISSSSIFGEWGHEGVCFRKQQGNQNIHAKLNVALDPNADDPNLQLFEILFPKKWILETVIPSTNNQLGEELLSYGELLRWIGLWILMPMVDGSLCQSFWSNKHVNIFEGAPFWLNNFMTRNRFEKILNNITYMNCEPPAFHDHFWEIQQMVEEWNANMDINFSLSWKNCLDESMSKWLNEYACPGFMFVPRKPWKFGNEWHDIGCADTNVIWQLEIREGKDQPHELPKEHDNKGKTVGTLLHLMKPIHRSGKLVVLDSGFCVLQGLIELKKLGVFDHALIKKHWYWPKHVKGDDIIQHFANEEVRSADALQGQFDGVPVYIYSMKEPDYTMMLMATYDTLVKQGEEKTRNFMDGGSKVVKKFKYPEVVYNP